MQSQAFLLILLAAAPAPAADLFRDDFSRFPPGWLSTPVGTQNPAIQEYHYLPHRGVPLGPWANAIAHMDAWMVSDEDGHPYLEELLDSTSKQWSYPIFLTGEPEWDNYSIEAKVKPLNRVDSAGIAFRYRTNRSYYYFALTGGNKATLRLHLPLETALRQRAWKDLGSVDFNYDTTRYHTLRLEGEGPRIRAFIDGKQVIEAQDSGNLQGKIALVTTGPARFQDVRVSTSDANAKQIAARIATREADLQRLRASNPKPKLWKKFDTPKFGAGRNVRFGDLDGDGVPDMLIAQNIPRVRGDAFDQISCLTAVNLDGKVLWQSGRPDPRNGLLTNDTPFQIHDIDGDGRNEIVLVRDFKLQVLDGRTGKLLRSTVMPKLAPNDKEHPYDLHPGDSIAFVNVSGNKGRHEILVKDRYTHFWIYNNKLELLWQGDGQTGHFPYPAEVGSSGKDSLFIGYAMWSPEGKQLWSNDKAIRDHADGLMVGNLTADPKAAPRVYASGSDEGFLVMDLDGKLRKQVRVGHNQSPSVGKYRPDLPGLQYISVNFWTNPGIVTLFDADGNLLAQDEPIHTGSPMLPVNWRGDGQEFVLLSGNPKEGGMVDGHIRRVVMFPDDGHPDLAANVIDLTGDQRDEIVLWDQNRVWIYTQDRPFQGSKIYAPVRNPDYNESNYRTNVSFPNWEAVRVKP